MHDRTTNGAPPGPSSAAAALVGLASLFAALSPSCPPQSPRPSAAPPASDVDGASIVRASDDAGPPVVDAGPPAETAREPLGKLRVQVLGPGAAGARVTLAGSGVWPPRECRADERGEAVFDSLAEGVYAVSARHGVRVAQPREGLWLGARQRLFVALPMRDGVTLEGIVVNASDGLPVAGAELALAPEALSLDPRRARAGPDGRFRFEGLWPGPQTLSARAPAFVGVTALPVSPPSPTRIELTPGATIEGVVSDREGRPIAGARVDLLGERTIGAVGAGVAASLGTTTGPVPTIPLVPTAGTQPWIDPGGSSAVTDASGRYRLEGVPPGAARVLAVDADHAPSVRTVPPLRPAQRLGGLDLVLDEGARIFGRVLDGGGFPVGRVPIVLEAEREPLARMVSTGVDGSFEFGHVLGRASLTTRAPGVPTRREHFMAPERGELEVEVRLEDALWRLEGRVLDEAGFPIPGATVELESTRPGAPGVRVASSGDDGGFYLIGLMAPPWRVRATKAGRLAAIATLAEAPSQPLALHLGVAAELTLTLRSAFDGQALEAAQVLATQGGVQHEAAPEGGGVYRFDDLSVGPLSLRIAAPGHLPLTRDATVVARPGSPPSLDLGELRLAIGGAIEGDVVDANGEAVEGARITLDGTAWPGVTSGGDGGFRATGIAPDTYHVGAVLSEQVRAEAPTAITVYGAQTTPGVHIVLPTAVESGASVVPPVASGGVGLAIRLRDRAGSVEVVAVASGSTAARAGLRSGDVLVAVDGSRPMIAAQARSALRGEVGTRVSLRVLRGGRERTLRVERERYGAF